MACYRRCLKGIFQKYPEEKKQMYLITGNNIRQQSDQRRYWEGGGNMEASDILMIFEENQISQMPETLDISGLGDGIWTHYLSNQILFKGC